MSSEEFWLSLAGHAGTEPADNPTQATLDFMALCRRYEGDPREQERIRDIGTAITCDETCYSLAQAALERGDTAAALELLPPAAEAGVGEAPWLLACLLEETGDTAGAVSWYQHAAADGDSRAARKLLDIQQPGNIPDDTVDSSAAPATPAATAESADPGTDSGPAAHRLISTDIDHQVQWSEQERSERLAVWRRAPRERTPDAGATDVLSSARAVHMRRAAVTVACLCVTAAFPSVPAVAPLSEWLLQSWVRKSQLELPLGGPSAGGKMVWLVKSGVGKDALMEKILAEKCPVERAWQRDFTSACTRDDFWAGHLTAMLQESAAFLAHASFRPRPRTQTAADVMLSPERLPVIGREATLHQALDQVLNAGGRALPVHDERDQVIGVVTLADLAQRVYDDYGAAAIEKVGRVMRTPVMVTPETPIAALTTVVSRSGSGFAVVIKPSGEPAGYVTADMLLQPPPANLPGSLWIPEEPGSQLVTHGRILTGSF